VAGCCECRDEPSGSCATDLVHFVCHVPYQATNMSYIKIILNVLGKIWHTISLFISHFEVSPKTTNHEFSLSFCTQCLNIS
jgi:hypothetical protein